MSPEQLGKGDGKIGISADIWSFVAMVYEMFTGEAPFGTRKNGDTDSVIVTNILSKIELDKIYSVPIPYRDIVLKCLQKNPSDRFTDCNEILYLLDNATQVIEEKESGEIVGRDPGNEIDDNDGNDDKTILVDKEQEPTKIPEGGTEELESDNEKGNILEEGLIWLAKYWWVTLVLISLTIWIWIIIHVMDIKPNSEKNVVRDESSVGISKPLENSTENKSAFKNDFSNAEPQFPGGHEALLDYLQKNIRYPPEELSKGIQGTVEVRFAILEDGTVWDVTVIKNVSPGLDQEAVRAVRTLPKFYPGKRNGEPEVMYVSLPVFFNINN
jgi:TonB family protein